MRQVGTHAWSERPYGGVRTTTTQPGYGWNPSYLSRHLAEVGDDGRVYWDFYRGPPTGRAEGYTYVHPAERESSEARVDPGPRRNLHPHHEERHGLQAVSGHHPADPESASVAQEA